jgi:hypothetical protein
MTSRLLVDKIEGKSTSGTIQMPAGMIVQTSFQQFTTNTSLSSTSDADVGGSSLSFTPKFASSLLILSCSVSINIYRSNINNGCTINFNVDGSNIDNTGADYELLDSVPSGNTNVYVRMNKESSINATNTNAKTIKLTGRVYQTGSSGVAVVNSNSYFTSSIKIQEIAQ